VVAVVLVTLLVGWVGFWGAVLRVHYLSQNWFGLLLTAALATVPAVEFLSRELPVDGPDVSAGEALDVLTPS
jgi:hypothetical protein